MATKKDVFVSVEVTTYVNGEQRGHNKIKSVLTSNTEAAVQAAVNDLVQRLKQRGAVK